MKVTFTPEGEVSIDTDDVAQAAELIREFRNGSSKPSKPRGPYKKKQQPEPVEEESLSPEAVETWNWLVAHDSPKGVHVHAVAQGLGIEMHSVTHRLKKLIDKGLARRVKRGVYRAGGAVEPRKDKSAEEGSEVAPDSP